MLKARKGCKTCDLIVAGDKKLERRINESRLWVKGGETLTNIAKDYPTVPYTAMHNHSQKHQAPGQKAILIKNGRAKLREIEDQKALEVGKAVSHHDARSRLTALGLQGIENNQIKMTAAAVVQLLKQEMDIEEKAKDRTAEMMKTFAFFASGEGRGKALEQPHIEDVVEGELVE